MQSKLILLTGPLSLHGSWTLLPSHSHYQEPTGYATLEPLINSRCSSMKLVKTSEGPTTMHSLNLVSMIYTLPTHSALETLKKSLSMMTSIPHQDKIPQEDPDHREHKFQHLFPKQRWSTSISPLYQLMYKPESRNTDPTR